MTGERAPRAAVATPEPGRLPKRLLDRLGPEEGLGASADTQLIAEKAASYGRWRIRAADATVAWSVGTAEIFGRTMPSSGCIGLDEHLACYHPEDAPLVRRRIDSAMAGRKLLADGSYRGRGRILRPGGEVRHVAIHGVAERDATGRVVALHGILLDVTDQVRTERQARDAGALLRLTLETMDHGLIMLGADGCVRVHNEKARELIGVGRDLLHDGAPFDEVRKVLVARGEYRSVDRKIRDWAESGGLERVATIYQRQRPDGRSIEIRAVPLPDGGVVRTYVDVSARRQSEDALVAGERRFRLLAENTTDVVIWSGLDTVRRYVSPASLAVLGYAPEELVGTRPLDFVHPEDAAAYAGVLDDLCSGRIDQAVTCQRYRHRHGHFIHIEVSFKVTRDDTDVADGYVASLRDATARKSVEDALRLSEERLSLALDGGSDGLWDWDVVRETIAFSGRWPAMLGFGEGEREQRQESYWHDIHRDDRERVRTSFAEHLNDDTPVLECEYRARTSSGEHRWTLARGKIVARGRDGRPARMVGTLVDITRRKEADALVAHMATHDVLTGLANRALFRERLEQRIAETRRTGARFAVIACDLDRFKSVNDSLGHAAGDRLLQDIAGRLSATVRAGDTVARLGGDEFAVLVSEPAGAEAIAALAGRLVEKVVQPTVIEGHPIAIGVSVGVALAPDDGLDAEGLHRSADLAMYRAKADGRNAVRFFTAGMDAAMADRADLARDLGRALDMDALSLQYQPVVDVAARKIVGFEALLRWTHPERGAIPPSVFIPVAEAQGLITRMGEWALREACRRAARWPRTLRMAVNVSAVQFREPERLERAVLEALVRTGVSPNRLELEITESVLMDDAETVIACLHRLREIGVRVALDDFGIGFSSLAYLRRFPFDRVKIDRSFVQDMARPVTGAIVRSVIDIAAAMGAGVVAEGVEDRDQLEAVRRVGCIEVQGYLFSKPLDADEAGALIHRYGRSHTAAAAAGRAKDRAAP